MHPLYELLKDRGLTNGSPKSISDKLVKFRPRDQILLLEDMNKAIDKEPSSNEKHLLSFFVSSSLGGGTHPCFMLDCRRRGINTLCRTAALFADSILVPQPFPNMSMDCSTETGRSEATNLGSLTERLANDIVILWDMQPLIDADIIRIAKTSFHFCADCARKFKEQQKSLSERLQSVEDMLGEQMLNDIEFSVDTDMPGLLAIKMRGPEKWLPHGSLAHIINLHKAGGIANDLLALPNHKVLSREDVKRLQLYSSLISPSILNASLGFIYAKHNRLMYLSDQELDFEVLRLLSSTEEREITNASLVNLTHELPFPINCDIESIVKLRQDEGESFRVYRDKICDCLKHTASCQSTNFSSLLRDEIMPEVRKIELTLRNNKRALLGKATQDLALGCFLMSIGMLAGLAGAEAEKLLAGIGGLGFLSATGKKVWDAFSIPIQVRDNPFYFLWKVKHDLQKRV